MLNSTFHFHIFKNILQATIIVFGFLSSSFLSSQAIWTDPIDGNGVNHPNTNPFSSASVIDANITISGVGLGSGVTLNAANNRYNAQSWTTSTSLDLADYFTFTLTPNSGYKINFSSFVFTSQTSATGPTNFAVRSSLNGFSSDISTPNATGASVSLSSSNFQGITSSITFRIYGFSAGGGSGTYSINDFSFSGIVLLPIELASFDVNNQSHPQITWSTYSELNNDYFTLLRSKNGTDFHEITQVRGNGSTDKKNDYSFTDQSPFPGKVFYQLKQTDFNGQFTFSPIRSIVVAIGMQQPIVYPSLVDNEINIDFSNTKPSSWSWTLVNMQGQLIKKGVVKNPEDLVSVSSDMAPSGVVILTLISETGMYNYRLVKN